MINKLIFFDFEVFRSYWLCVCIDYETREKIIIQTKQELQEVYDKHKQDIFLGYNSRNYDVFILKSILLNMNPFEISQRLIEGDEKGNSIIPKAKDIPFNNFDLSIGFRGLKELEGFMGSSIVESEIDFNLERELTKEEIESTIKYCTHDVEESIKVYENSKEEFESQLLMIKAFDLSMDKFNFTKAQLSAIILGAVRPKKERTDEFNITIVDTIKLDKYKFVADWYLDEKNKDYNKQLICNIADVPHVFAFGGVHGAVNGYIEEGLFFNADVNSFYPAIMIEYDFLSRNVKDKNKYREIRDRRIQLKKEKNPLQAPLKILLNSVFGSSNDEHNELYDTLQANNVCINGQLLLLDLIEKVEPYCKLVNVNTDGILVKFEKIEDKTYFLEECEKWSKRVRMELEFEECTKVIQKDVNNYIIVDKNGKYKSKGAYVKKLSKLDYDLPIVNEALLEYFIHNTPIENTINSCNDMIKFQKIVKVTRLYKYAEHNGLKIKEKVLRVYASTDENDGCVFKIKGENKKEKIANTPEKCFIYNDEVLNLKCIDKLDKNYYIIIANDRLEKFKNSKFKIKSLNSGIKFIRFDSINFIENQEFTDIFNVLDNIEENSNINKRELEILVKLDYFNEFGNSKRILEFIPLYSKYRKNRHKFTSTLFATENEYDIWNNINHIEDYTIQEKIKFNLEYLGYINFEIPKNTSIARVELVSSKNDWCKLISLRNQKEDWYQFNTKPTKNDILLFYSKDISIECNPYKRDIFHINKYEIIKLN